MYVWMNMFGITRRRTVLVMTATTLENSLKMPKIGMTLLQQRLIDGQSKDGDENRPWKTQLTSTVYHHTCYSIDPAGFYYPANEECWRSTHL